MKPVTTRPQAARGHKFPLGVGEIRRLVRASGITDAEGRSITIRHNNPNEAEPNRILILELLPQRELSVYSVPEQLSPEVVGDAVRMALPVLAAHNDRPKWSRNEVLIFFALLNPLAGQISVYRRLVKLERPKYRGNAKFSNAFKARVSSLEDAVLETLSLRPA